MKHRVVLGIIVLALLCTSCRPLIVPATSGDEVTDTDARTRPAHWTEATHGKSVDPNYGIVFSQDEVKRIDFTIDATDWRALLDNLTALYGPSGARAGGPGGHIPPGTDKPPRPSGNLQGDTPPVPGNRPDAGGDALIENMGSIENPIYVPATVTFEGKTWTHVGLRFKGNSSLMTSWGSGIMKLPIRLDFDQFEEDYPEIEDQRFYGFEQLAFSSNFNDASFLREKVTADIFRAAGVPAAQTAFYAVYLDYGEAPIYFGLYTLTEIVEDTLIQTQFEDNTGNIYKPEGRGASFAEGTFSETAFEKQNHKKETDWSDIQALFNVLHAATRTSNPAAWRSALETSFDVNGFLNWLAVNAVIQNWDTYGVMPHNYYLYHDPTTDKLIWIPWDNNMALSSNQGMRDVLSLSMHEVDENWPLIRYLLDDSMYYAQYVANVDAVIHDAFEPARMETIYRELAVMIEPYALGENEEHTFLKSDEAFHSAVEELVEHTSARYETAAAFVASQQP